MSILFFAVSHVNTGIVPTQSSLTKAFMAEWMAHMFDVKDVAGILDRDVTAENFDRFQFCLPLFLPTMANGIKTDCRTCSKCDNKRLSPGADYFPDIH